MYIQWNLSIADTLGTAESVLISEVSTFQGNFTHVCNYTVGTHNSVLITEVSSLQGSRLEGFHHNIV